MCIRDRSYDAPPQSFVSLGALTLEQRRCVSNEGHVGLVLTNVRDDMPTIAGQVVIGRVPGWRAQANRGSAGCSEPVPRERSVRLPDLEQNGAVAEPVGCLL